MGSFSLLPVVPQVQYHADFEKLKGHKTSVAEDPEMARIKQNTAIQSNINYWGVREQRNAMEEKRPQETVDEGKGRGIGLPRSLRFRSLLCGRWFRSVLCGQ